MKRFLYLPLLFFIISIIQMNAQEVELSGTLLDSINQKTLNGASIFLFSQSDTNLRLFTTSDDQGSFAFKKLDPADYELIVSFIGYHTLDSIIKLTTDLDLGPLYFRSSIEDLEEVQIVEHIPMAVQKGDTVQFNADAFKTNPDATAEDLAKKMPGIVIDDDNIQAQGEDVKKVLVDGKPFFGDDPRLALKTIPAEVIQKIEVFDKLSDQAEFTGFDDGESVKTMNIVTRPEMRNGQFGRAYAGYGTDDRYTVGGNINFFNSDQRISIIGLSNNINQQNFSTEDLLGVMSSGSRGRGGKGGGGRSPGGGSGPTGTSGQQSGSANNFMVGPQNGITNTHSAGINYTDKWGEKIDITGSYFFNIADNASNEYLNRENILVGDSNLFYNEVSKSTNKNYNHRFNIKFDYKIDSFNSILIRPRFSIQSNTYSSNVLGVNSLDPESLISSTINNYNDNASGYNFNNDLLYRHAFRKRGRTISFNAKTGLNSSTSDNDLLALNEYFESTINASDTINQITNSNGDGYSLAANIMYTEPISKAGQVYANLNSSFSRNYSLTETYNFDYGLNTYSIFDTTLSSEYDNDYLRNSIGTGLRFNTTKMHLTAGLSVQRAELISNPVFPESIELDKTFTNVLPNAMMRLNFSRTSNLRVHYRANTNAPSITQLQNVIDNSNPLSITAGNPDLKQEYSNMLMTRYSLSQIMKSKFMYLLIYLKHTNDYIGNSTYTASRDTLIGGGVILNKGSQLSIPVNMDAYWNARSFFTLGLPLVKNKLNLNLNTGITFSKTPGIINATENYSNTWGFSQGLVFSSNISEKIDFTLSYMATYNIVNNTIQDELDNNYFYQSAGFDFSLIFWKGMVLRNQLKYQFYNGLTEELNDSYLLWNIELGKKFLKNQVAEIKLVAFDILDQNQSISRTVTESYIEDATVEVLQRYFMLTFTYTLKNFKSNGSKRHL